MFAEKKRRKRLHLHRRLPQTQHTADIYSLKNRSIDDKLSAQAVIFLASASLKMATEEEAAMQSVTKVARFDWPRLAKRAAFLLATAGVFSAGKLAAVGITLTVALACKLFARERHSYGSFPSAETGKGGGSSSVILMRDGEAALVKRSKDPSPSPVSNLVIEAHGHVNMPLRDPAMAANGNANLVQRKELRRSTCIRLPPTAVVEAIQNSPSSVVCSPGTWFLDEGRSIPTGANSAGSAEINKQSKAKSKALIRHLRKKEPTSASSTPLMLTQETSVLWNASSISDGSVTERFPPPPPATLQKNYPSNPAAAASPLAAKEAQMADGNNPVPEQQSLRASALRKGKKKQSAPAIATAREAIRTDLATLSVGQEFLHRRGEKKQSVLKPVAKERMAEHTIAPSANQVSVQVSSVRKGGKKKKQVLQQATVGVSWIALGLMIIIAGLLMGRMAAIAGLVCYWYALCLRACRKSR